MSVLSIEQKTLWNFLNGELLDIPHDLDYNYLLMLLRRHKLQPLEKDFLQYLPSEIYPKWKHDLQRWAVRSLMLTIELKKVCIVLEESNIYPITLKGPVLSQQLFANVDRRYYSDIDILIEKEEVFTAVKRLVELGYEIKESEKAFFNTATSKYLYSRYSIGLKNNELNIYLELHFRLAAFGHRLPKQLQHLKTDPIKVIIGGHAFTTLNNESNFIYLCYHGSKHLYLRLSWLRDAAFFLTNINLDHSSVIKRLKELKLSKHLGITLLLAHDFFNVAIPEEYSPFLKNKFFLSIAYKLNKKIISGPYIQVSKDPFHFIKSNGKIKGVNQFSVTYWFYAVLLSIYFRKGILTKSIYNVTQRLDLKHI